MRKNFKYFVAVWAIALALFNVIAFVFAGMISKNIANPSFWIGYVFITLAFAGQLVCANIAFKAENLTKMFYNMPLISVSQTGLILTLICGAVCMVVPFIPYWAGIIACAVILAFTAMSVVKAVAAGNIVSEIDDKIKAKTVIMKSLTADAESLVSRAKTDTAKKETKRVFEAARYSDPMSNDALSGIESEILGKFSEFSGAVAGGDDETVSVIADELVILIDDRNRKCKLLK